MWWEASGKVEELILILFDIPREIWIEYGEQEVKHILETVLRMSTLLRVHCGSGAVVTVLAMCWSQYLLTSHALGRRSR